MKKERVFWGLFIIVGAIFLIISKLFILPEFSVMSILLTIFFVASFIESLVHLRFFGIFFSVAFLGIIYDDYLHIQAITPWTILGVALLLSIGFSMIFGKVISNKRKEHFVNNSDFSNATVLNSDNAVSFGAAVKYINDDNFEGTSLKCSFGALKVYFDNATIANGHASVFLDVSFGGVELYVPKEWNVVINTNCSLGGVTEENCSHKTIDSPTLELNGTLSFSGAKIYYI